MVIFLKRLLMVKKGNKDIELTDYPNEKYKRFFDRFKEIETIELKNWKSIHVLAYFCQKYKTIFNTDYQFKLNHSSPNKSYELFRINTLAMKLSSDPIILKGYIDWIFSEKIKEAKRRFTSISFLTNEDTLNFYKINFLLATKITRSNNLLLPGNPQWESIKTYGDLAFFLSAYRGEKDPPSKYRDIMSFLTNIHFDFSLLEKL